MPTWRIHREGECPGLVEADRIEETASGWQWWTVVVIINEPRWACVRRLGRDEGTSVTGPE